MAGLNVGILPPLSVRECGLRGIASGQAESPLCTSRAKVVCCEVEVSATS